MSERVRWRPAAGERVRVRVDPSCGFNHWLDGVDPAEDSDKVGSVIRIYGRDRRLGRHIYHVSDADDFRDSGRCPPGHEGFCGHWTVDGFFKLTELEPCGPSGGEG